MLLAAPHRHRHRRRILAVLLGLALVVLPACGSAPGEPAESGSGAPTPVPDADPSTITVSAVDFSFVLDRETVAAGSWTLRLVNDGGATHDVVLERDGQDVARSATVDHGETTTLAVDLEPGEYVLYCSIANHRAMGMEITVTVT